MYQKQLNKQAVEQKVDLEYNIDFLGRALSKAEMYAFRFGDPVIEKKLKPRFGYYNRFNNNTEREKLDLFKSFINSIKFVDYGFEETEDKFNEILFPSNMTKEEIIKHIADLSSYVYSAKEKAVYEDLMKVVLRIAPNYTNYQDLYNKDAKMNAKEMMEHYPGVNKAFGKKENDWTKKYEENPEHHPGFELDKRFEDDKDFSNYESKNKRNKKSKGY